ncbi:hypothetical protein QE152_g11321 [Popillia japonica]|uniref:Uncharacterized protein n=1 Tax=Popillia japonica TaxID=7064 RepID=A0AAW1LSL9_POPJA
MRHWHAGELKRDHKRDFNLVDPYDDGVRAFRDDRCHEIHREKGLGEVRCSAPRDLNVFVFGDGGGRRRDELVDRTP